MNSSGFGFSVLAISLALALGACTTPQAESTRHSPAAAQDTAFQAWVESLVDDAANDPNYRRIPLDTTAQTNAFTERLHGLYRHRISEAEFRSWVDAQYPGHVYEQDFIIQHLARHRRRGT